MLMMSSLAAYVPDPSALSAAGQAWIATVLHAPLGWQLGALLTAAALAVTLFGEIRGPLKLTYVFKPIASIGFLIAAWASGALTHSWGMAIAVGLVLSAVGDVLLLSRSSNAFLAGLVAFLFGHVAYLVAFAIRGFDPSVALIASVPLFVIALLFIRWLWARIDGPMRVPVVVYLVVITCMVALAFGSDATATKTGIVIGAVMFWLSDMSVAYHQFVRVSAVNRLWGLPFYYAAQLVLALAAGA
jgi:uncharacterized membrane protein YhhN